MYRYYRAPVRTLVWMRRQIWTKLWFFKVLVESVQYPPWYDHWRLVLSSTFPRLYCALAYKHIRRSLSTWWVSLLVDHRSPRANVAKFYIRLCFIRNDSRALNFSAFPIDWNIKFVDLLHHSCWFQLVCHWFWITFWSSTLLWFTRVQYPKQA